MKMWETYTIECHSDIKQRILSSANKTERAGGHCTVWNKPPPRQKRKKEKLYTIALTWSESLSKARRVQIARYQRLGGVGLQNEMGKGEPEHREGINPAFNCIAE